MNKKEVYRRLTRIRGLRRDIEIEEADIEFLENLPKEDRYPDLYREIEEKKIQVKSMKGEIERLSKINFS